MRLLLLLFALCPLFAGGQELSSVRTRWGNAFVEWDIFAYAPTDGPLEEGEDPPEEPFGEMKLRWLNLRDDFSEWEFQLGELRGTIRMPWKDDPTQWELRTFDNEVVTMRAAWSGDPTEWRVTNNAIALKLGSRWKNQLDEWVVDDPSYGRFYLYTFTEQDPRDWAIQDELSDEITPAMKVGLIFLTVFHSSPKQ
ncbi:MAG: hypothetical protein ACOYNO_08385 [Saprospiraceae bacterium]|jgi:hypothetical protein